MNTRSMETLPDLTFAEELQKLKVAEKGPMRSILQLFQPPLEEEQPYQPYYVPPRPELEEEQPDQPNAQAGPTWKASATLLLIILFWYFFGLPSCRVEFPRFTVGAKTSPSTAASSPGTSLGNSNFKLEQVAKSSLFSVEKAALLEVEKSDSDEWETDSVPVTLQEDSEQWKVTLSTCSSMVDLPEHPEVECHTLLEFSILPLVRGIANIEFVSYDDQDKMSRAEVQFEGRHAKYFPEHRKPLEDATIESLTGLFKIWNDGLNVDRIQELWSHAGERLSEIWDDDMDPEKVRELWNHVVKRLSKIVDDGDLEDVLELLRHVEKLSACTSSLLSNVYWFHGRMAPLLMRFGMHLGGFV
jgi:hypothetical protein